MRTCRAAASSAQTDLLPTQAGQENGSVIHGFDRSSRMDAEIKAVMRALGNSVENTLRAIDVRCRRVHRGSEVAVPFAFWRDLVEVLFFDLVGIGNLLDLFGIRFRELPVDREL